MCFPVFANKLNQNSTHHLYTMFYLKIEDHPHHQGFSVCHPYPSNRVFENPVLQCVRTIYAPVGQKKA